MPPTASTATAVTRRRPWPAALTALTVLWVAVLSLAPVAVGGSGGGVEQRAGALVYAFGRLICHQQASRSFHVSGVQLPVCARCTGLYAGAALGAAVALGARGRLRSLARRTRSALAAAAVPTALTMGLEWAGWLPDGNLARFAAAVPLGAVVAMLFATGDRADW